MRLLAVDGNSLGHRAWHTSAPGSDDGGDRVTAGVVSMLATAWVHGPYDGLLLAFDHPVNRRRLEHPEYKAGRARTPAGLTEALRALRQRLATAGLPVELHEGAEADDVLAAVVDATESRAWHCDVLSSDRDLTALVGPRTRLLRPRRRFSDLSVEDEAAVVATYGIEPWQYTELAALRGDPSDGLRGAPGIGPRLAARLLRDHGTVAALYGRLHELPPRLEASLRTARDRVERNLLLMAPIPHLEVDVVRAVSAGVATVELTRVLEPLGLGAAAARLHRAVTSPPPPAPPPPASPPGPDADVAPAGVSSTGVSSVGPAPARRALPPPAAAGEQAELF